MTETIDPEACAMALIQAARHHDVLGLLRLQKHARKTGSIEQLNAELVNIAVALLGVAFDENAGQIDLFLGTWLDAAKEDQPG